MYFSKREQDDLSKKGGVEETRGEEAGMSAENITMALDMVQKIATKESEGFFFAMARDGQKNEGIAKLYKMDKVQVLELVIRALQISPKGVIALGVSMIDAK